MRRFERGQSDCCAFVQHLITELGGRAYLPEYGDDWRQVLERHGGFEAAVTHFLDRQPKAEPPESFDVALVRVRGQESLGMVYEGQVYTMFEDGVPRTCKMKYVKASWTWDSR